MQQMKLTIRTEGEPVDARQARMARLTERLYLTETIVQLQWLMIFGMFVLLVLAQAA